MKFCSSCGSQVPDDARFCGNCRNMIQPGAISLTPDSAIGGAKTQSASRIKYKIAIGAFLTIFIITGGFFGWNQFGTEARVNQKLELAVKYLNDNNYQQAILAYNEAIKIDPRNVEARVGLAQAYIGNDEYEKAEDAVDKAMNIGTLTSAQYKKIITAYIDKGKFEKAKALLDIAKEKYSNDLAIDKIEKLLANKIDVQLTADFWIPDINKTYVYTVSDIYNDNNQYKRQKTVAWKMNSDGSYLRYWDQYNFETDGALEKYGSHEEDTYIRKGSSVYWTLNSGWADQAGSYDESLNSGERIIVKQATPGQKWDNVYKTSLNGTGAGESHTEKVSFIGFEDIDVLGSTQRAAHININGTYIYSDGNNESTEPHNYKIDYWLVKGIGVVKLTKCDTSNYNNQTFTQNETDLLTEIK